MTARKRIRGESELEALIRDEETSTLDDLRRIELLREETIFNRELNSINRKVKDVFERLWIYYSSFYSEEWQVVDPSTISSIIPRRSPSLWVRPSGLPRQLNASDTFIVKFLWKEMIPKEVWNHTAIKTAEKIKEVKEKKAGMPKLAKRAPGGGRRCEGPPHGSAEEIEAMVTASVIHTTFYSGIPATEYFRAVLAPHDPPSSIPLEELATQRRHGISLKRFWLLRRCISFDPNLIARLLSSVASSNEFILPGGAGCVVDEALMSCQAKDAPTVFIARKPHPVGLRFYLTCASFSRSGRTFCLNILPDLQPEALALRVAQVLNHSFDIVRRLSSLRQIHLTGDAFFGVKEILSNPPRGIKFTMSWNKNRGKDFWITMFHKFGEKSKMNRVAAKKPFIASVFRDEGDMCLISNALTCSLFATTPTPVTLLGEQNSPDTNPGVDESTEPADGVDRQTCHRCHATTSRYIRCVGCPKSICTQRCSALVSKEFVNEIFFLSFCETLCRTAWKARFKEGTHAQPSQTTDQPDPAPFQVAENMATKMTLSDLKALARSHGYSDLGNKRDLAFRISRWLETPAPVPKGGFVPQSSESTDPTSQLTGSTSTSTSSSSALNPSDSASSSAEFVDADQDASPPVEENETPRDLTRLSDSKLRSFLRTHKLTPKTDRSTLLKQATLLQMVLDNSTALTDLENSFLVYSQTGNQYPITKPICHKIYGEDFNQVDIHNRRAYEILAEGCRHANWHLTCFKAMIAFAIANMHAWWAEKTMKDGGIEDNSALLNEPCVTFIRNQLCPLFKSKFN